MNSLRFDRALAVVLAGGRGSRLGGLTDSRCKPAMPFGGAYRTIDFVLANCMNSGIGRVGVVTQYHGQSLIRHLGRAWMTQGSGFGDRLEVWPADQRHGGGWYSGTADAVYGNLDIIASEKPSMVLVLAADHVYRMDYRRLMEAHRASGASVTVAAVEVDCSEARHFGVMQADTCGRIRRFEEKPASVAGITTRSGKVLASMGVYVFDTETLVSELEHDAGDADSGHDFGKDIIPRMVGGAGGGAHCYRFRNEHTGSPAYWRDIGTVESYWRAHMEMLGTAPALDPGAADWPMPSVAASLPPPRFNCDERTGEATVLLDALVAPGCTLMGTLVRESILFPGVQVASGTVLERCVVLPGARIGSNCRLIGAVVDEGAVIADGTVLGDDGEVVVVPARRGISRAGRGTRKARSAAARTQAPLGTAALPARRVHAAKALG